MLKKLSYTHEAMIDLIIAEPTVSHAELAAVFSLSPGWISRVIGSDSFQARLAERKAKLIDPALSQSLNERVRGVTIQSLQIISEKLDAEQSAAYAIDALGVVSKSLSGSAAR